MFADCPLGIKLPASFSKITSTISVVPLLTKLLYNFCQYRIPEKLFFYVHRQYFLYCFPAFKCNIIINENFIKTIEFMLIA